MIASPEHTQFPFGDKEVTKADLLFKEAETYLLLRHNKLPELPDKELADAITKLDELYQRDRRTGAPSPELEHQMYEVVYPLIRRHQVPPRVNEK